MTPQAKEIGIKHENTPPTNKTPSAETPAKGAATSASAPARGRDVFGMLRAEIDRLFDDFTHTGRDWSRALSLPAGFGALSAPAMDFVANDGSYELRVDLPGLKPRRSSSSSKTGGSRSTANAPASARRMRATTSCRSGVPAGSNA
ncbi:hypothetical protein [Thioclava electrotropha]|uniref:hypothetical protein n=1 Tax=Thioclava electrotropha TaxID=1549850 RepID=UPI001E2FED86|nr:hypothetical protein [Thioclava electrotropha]